ncbi:MAG: class I SAM-dependent methyltransferase [Desulfobacula sp.]|uniref:class I SAM-dependent methyltransferase n=1 Tax=Desulfobacula sp. TaxID=2593537 RepID=UPI00345C3AC4|nr:class I SAM-dependent methyltransferase [Desulfobacula sp.]
MLGHKVVCADINKENTDFVFADMSQPLSFKDNEFDIVICMEGIEHVLEPVRLISELCRICKAKGKIFITTPNIQNMYSRFQFLCTGTFY